MENFYRGLEFECDGNRYVFQAIASGCMPDGTLKDYSIPNDYMIMFMSANELNNLCIAAELECEDHDGSLSWIRNATYASINVVFAQYKRQSDGNIVIDDYYKDRILSHNFLVDNIEIIERERNVVKYRLKLRSYNWYLLSKSIYYSNHDGYGDDIFKIARDILVQCVGKDRISDSFQNVTADVRLTYAASPKDNFFTSYAYLYRCMFYGSTRSKSIKGIYFDEYTNKYSTFDIAQFSEDTSIHHDLISISNSTLEQHASNYVETQIGSIVSYPRTLEFKLDFPKHLIDYDYDSNKFINCDMHSEEIVQLQNANVVKDATELKGPAIFADLYKSHIEYGAMWNNDFNVALDAFNKLMNENTMIINVKGVLGRQVNDYEVVGVDSSVHDSQSSKPEEIAKQKQKYAGISGTWLIGKVVNIIDFKRPLYRQNLVLLKTMVPTEKK